jgi:hypothetical protein
MLRGAGIVTNVVEAGIVCLMVAYVLTLLNFFLHIVIRCLWIGALGSRSVMGTTIFARRRLAPRFQQFLQRRNGNFDAYIRRLDDVASLVFAFTFLLIAAAVSFFSVVLIMGGIANYANTNRVPDWAAYCMLGLFLLYIIAAIVYLIDFLTAGFLKRFRRFSVVYYPVYRFFGWLTLARLYRPLYYNLLNKRGGRRLVYLLIPYLLLAVIAISFRAHPNTYVGKEYFSKDYNSAQVLDYNHYEDRLPEGSPLGIVMLPAEIIRSSPLRVIVPLTTPHAEYTAHACPDLPPLYASVLTSELFDAGRGGYYDGASYRDSSKLILTPQTKACLLSAIEIYLDGKRFPNENLYLRRNADDPIAQAVGFLPLDSLEAGMHELRYLQYEPPHRRHPEDTVVRYDLTVPFYYAPES